MLQCGQLWGCGGGRATSLQCLKFRQRVSRPAGVRSTQDYTAAPKTPRHMNPYFVKGANNVETMTKTYWQIAAGSLGRNYAGLFLKFGMAFVGGAKEVSTMAEVSVGDVVLLKIGRSKVFAVGEVVTRNGKHQGNGDKPWLKDFDGWDLSAYCYVDWRVPDCPVLTSALTRATIQRVHKAEHKQIADSLLKLTVQPYEPEPPPTELIDDTIILEFLIGEGLRPSAADELTNTFRRIRLLADYYYRRGCWEDIREHETRSFLVVPLLLALGWAEQQIKIELPIQNGRVDIACFSRTYQRNNNECVLILETKDFSSGLDYAPEQAHRYAEAFPSCQVVVVTNGYCYKTYIRSNEGKFDLKPSAYFNLLRPKDKYPLDPLNVNGALGVLKWLLPNNVSSLSSPNNPST